MNSRSYAVCTSLFVALSACAAQKPLGPAEDAATNDAADAATNDAADDAADAGHVSTSSCGPTNCKGCCEGDVCRLGDSSAACGTGGETCSTCPTIKHTCLPTKVCGYHPDVAWHVVVESAVIEPTNGTASWDASGGAPDPFVRIWCPPSASTPKVSTTMVDTVTPKWPLGADCFIPYKELSTTGFAIEVLDDDVAVNDTIMPKTIVVPKAGDVANGSMVISNAVAKVTVKIL